MERYGYIYGTDSVGEYSEIATSPGIRDFVQKQGTPFPMDALDQMLKILGGYEFLPGFENQPDKCKPVAVRYAPVKMAGLYDMPGDMKPVYALCVSGMELRMGYKKMGYDALVTMDYEGLLKDEEHSYLDQIFGTYLLSSKEADELRRNGKGVNPSLPPERVAVNFRKEDAGAVMKIVCAVISGKRVVIRLEKGYVFNQRAFEILTQVYAMLYPRLAVEVGFATYQNPATTKELATTADTRIFVVPGEADNAVIPDNGILVDLSQPQEENSNLAKCVKLWQNVPQEDRMDAMSKVLSDPKQDVWNMEYFMKATLQFFMIDKFFKYKPVSGKCSNLEELKMEYDQFPALRLDTRWLTKKFAKMVPVLLGPELKLGELKARVAAELGSAADEDTRQKYTDLYLFAQKLDDGDASLYAVIQTRNVIQEQADARNREQKEHYEQKISEMTATHDKAMTDQRTAHSKALAEQKAAHDKAMTEQRSSHQKALATQKTTHDKALADAKKTLQEELNRAKSSATASGQQVTGLQKQLQEQKSSFEAEIRKLKAQNATAAQAGANAAQTAQLRREMEELKKTHEQEIALLKQQRPAAAPATGSAHTVSERAKQMMAAQILWNLARTEEQEAQILGPGAQ